MRFSAIIRYTGLVLVLNALFMLVAAVISQLHPGDGASLPLWLSAGLTGAAGLFPLFYFRPCTDISAKEGSTILALAWVASCLFGMLPYLFYGNEFTPINAWFESVSGYTTTGATILEDIESCPKGILFWRSATHWIGGLGVVLMLVLILPSMRVLKLRLVKTEISPLSKDNFKFRVVQTTRVISLMYAGLTLLEALLLMLAGMEGFDAVNHAFSTIATGGFSTRNGSIAAFHNGWVEVIITGFMIISGMHFGLLYMAFCGKYQPLWKSAAVRFYLGSLAVGFVVVTLNLYIDNTYASFPETMRHSLFQVASIGTTTGFSTTPTLLWPTFSILVLFYFSLQCACSGSTSGGIKADRVLILFKSIKSYLRQQQHPNAIVPVRVGGSILDNDVAYSVILFIVTYISVAVIGTFALALLNIDIMTSFSAAVACLGNVGQGFGGIADNYAGLPFVGKFILTLLMLFGRLEIFGLLLVLFVRTWR